MTIDSPKSTNDKDRLRRSPRTERQGMFTGIIEEQGTVERTDNGVLRIQAAVVLTDAVLGASIAVNGCCLTLVRSGFDWWEAEVSDETFKRTNLGSLRVGELVNLERPVRLEDRLGGHLVQGHVDAVGVIVRPAPDLRIRIPDDLRRYVVEKGSITVDGISLTIVTPTDDGFTAAIIPHTMTVTSLGHKAKDAPVNIEVDVIAKYVERLLEYRS